MCLDTYNSTPPPIRPTLKTFSPVLGRCKTIPEFAPIESPLRKEVLKPSPRKWEAAGLKEYVLFTGQKVQF